MHTSTKRYRVSMIALCFLAVAHVTPSQADPDPNVVFSLKEGAHWAPVVGADGPAFTLYDNRELIFLSRQTRRYRRVQLTEGQYTRLLEDIVPKDLPMLQDGYSRASVTCQNQYFFYFGSSRRTVSVYGHPTTNYGDSTWTEIPQSLRRCFTTIERYDHRRAVPWVADNIEVLVWDMFPTDEEFQRWPADWPDLSSPNTIRRSGVSSVFLPKNLFDEFTALLQDGPRVMRMNGKPMVVWYRMPIPGEGVFTRRPGRPPDKGTPLHVAARRGKLDTMTSLVEAGADANARDISGRTPLHEAVCQGHSEIVKFLLANGADANILARDSRSALHLAAERGHATTALLLIAHDADIRARTAHGNTPLLCALDFRQPDVANVLLTNGADVLAHNAAGDTGLHFAIDDQLTAITEQLIDGGLDANATNDAGDTPLYLASWNGALAIVELLLAHDADLQAAKPDGRTPLHAAAQAGHTGIVELLIAHGADVDARTREGDTPLDYAVHAARHDVVERLRTARTDGHEGTSVTSPAPF